MWPRNQILKFINLLHDYPILWDKSCPRHVNKRERECAWDEIAAEIKLSKTEVKKKLLTLRKHFNTVDKRKKAVEDLDYLPHWYFYKPLKSLFEHRNKKYQKIEKSLQHESSIESDTEYFDAVYSDADTSNMNSQPSAGTENAMQYVEPDEFTIFGETIANELRQMKAHKSIQLDFKHKVMTAILEANEELNMVEPNIEIEHC